MNTLAARLAHAMKGPPKVSQAALARACNVKPPTVNDWLSGKTTELKGANLLAVSKFLNVDPEWLANGKGGRHRPITQPVGDHALLSQPARLDLSIMRAAVSMTRDLLELQGLAPDLEAHVPLLALAYQIAAEDAQSPEPASVLDLTKRLAALNREEANRANQRREVAGTDSASGGLPGGAAAASASKARRR